MFIGIYTCKHIHICVVINCHKTRVSLKIKTRSKSLEVIRALPSVAHSFSGFALKWQSNLYLELLCKYIHVGVVINYHTTDFFYKNPDSWGTATDPVCLGASPLNDGLLCILNKLKRVCTPHDHNLFNIYQDCFW